jgi:hypothetical protein
MFLGGMMPQRQPRPRGGPPPTARVTRALDQAASALTAMIAYERAGLVDQCAVEAARWKLVAAATAFRAVVAPPLEEVPHE